MHFLHFLSVLFSVVLINSAPQIDNSTKALCSLRTTDQLIKHYGYIAERHTVKTEDGYILTIFRCNSKNSTGQPKKSVILQHGLLVSSDDWCINPPEQSLAYVLADAGYDVWLGNSRGNFYSRRHTTKDPNSIPSDFWDFSWYEMGIYDHPAVIDHILEVTNMPKLYYIGHSQGTTSLLVLLSERPEYNDKIIAASLMAPAGFFSLKGQPSNRFIKMFSFVASKLEAIPNTELFPRSRLFAEDFNSFCLDNLSLCDSVLNEISGPSENQRDVAMLPAFLCHAPSGASLKQVIHYYQQLKYGFFGKYKNGKDIPPDFPLYRITAPISLHMSTDDTLTKASDAQKLIPKMNSTKVFVHIINGTKFNHLDFAWGVHSASIVYSQIINFFQQF